MAARKRKAAQTVPMSIFNSSCSLYGTDEGVYEELPALFGSSPKRVALDSHSSGLSSQSELLCGEWLGYMNLDSSLDSSLHSSPSRTSNSSSASTDSLLSIATNSDEKAGGHQAGDTHNPPSSELIYRCNSSSCKNLGSEVLQSSVLYLPGGARTR